MTRSGAIFDTEPSVQMVGLILLCLLFAMTVLCAIGPGVQTRLLSKFWLVLGVFWLLPGWFFWFYLVERDLSEPLYAQRTLMFLGAAVFSAVEAVFLRWASLPTHDLPLVKSN